MKSLIRVFQDFGLLIARLITGATLLLHGWARWQDGISKQVEILTDLKVPYATIFGWGTVIFELAGGALLIFGLATPLVGLVLAVQQAMLIGYAKLESGPHVMEGGYEYNAALGALGLVFMVMGSGRAGVDALFRRPTDEPERHVIDDADPA